MSWEEKLKNKDHKNILADIRDDINKLGQGRGQLIFQESEYINNQNRKQPMYNITLDGVLQLGVTLLNENVKEIFPDVEFQFRKGVA